MSVKYNLTENLLTERADDYSAQVQASRSVDKDAFIDRMLQGNTLVSRTDILAVVNAMEETAVALLREGCNINLPLFNTSMSISGVFEGGGDTFDPSRHKFNINLHKGTLLRNLQGEIELEKVNRTTVQSVIFEVRDTTSGTVNERLTPGGIAELFGINIKVSGEDAACGVFIVAADGSETRIAALGQNKPSSIMFAVPALTAGSYTVKVITQYRGNSSTLKKPRTIVSDKILTVV